MIIVIQAIATPSLERSPGCDCKQIVYRKFVEQIISSQGRNSLGVFCLWRKFEGRGKYSLRQKKTILDGFSVFLIIVRDGSTTKEKRVDSMRKEFTRFF